MKLLDVAHKSELEALARDGLGDLTRFLDQRVVLRGDANEKCSNNGKSFECYTLLSLLYCTQKRRVVSALSPFLMCPSR